VLEDSSFSLSFSLISCLLLSYSTRRKQDFCDAPTKFFPSPFSPIFFPLLEVMVLPSGLQTTVFFLKRLWALFFPPPPLFPLPLPPINGWHSDRKRERTLSLRDPLFSFFSISLWIVIKREGGIFFFNLFFPSPLPSPPFLLHRSFSISGGPFLLFFPPPFPSLFFFFQSLVV